MASDNKLELVIEVQADKANAQIKRVNQSLASIERIAVAVAKNASEGIDGMTASMVKGSLAGNLLVETIRGAAEWVKEYVAGAVEMAARTERLQIGTQVLAKARGLHAKAARASRGRSPAGELPCRPAVINLMAATRLRRESCAFYTSPRPPASAIPQPGGRDAQCHLILGFERQGVRVLKGRLKRSELLAFSRAYGT